MKNSLKGIFMGVGVIGFLVFLFLFLGQWLVAPLVLYQEPIREPPKIERYFDSEFGVICYGYRDYPQSGLSCVYLPIVNPPQQSTEK